MLQHSLNIMFGQLASQPKFRSIKKCFLNQQRNLFPFHVMIFPLPPFLFNQNLGQLQKNQKALQKIITLHLSGAEEAKLFPEFNPNSHTHKKPELTSHCNFAVWRMGGVGGDLPHAKTSLISKSSFPSLQGDAAHVCHGSCRREKCIAQDGENLCKFSPNSSPLPNQLP